MHGWTDSAETYIYDTQVLTGWIRLMLIGEALWLTHSGGMFAKDLKKLQQKKY